MTDGFIILSKGGVYNETGMPVFDLSFLEQDPEDEFTIKQAKEVLFDLTNLGVHRYSESIVQWLQEHDRYRPPAETDQLDTAARNAAATAEEEEIEAPRKPVPPPAKRGKPKGKPGSRRFSDEEIREIRNTHGPLNAIAERWNVTPQSISNIQKRVTYRTVD